MAKRITPYQKKLWKIISEYIRRRDADHEGYTTCVTCGVRKHWSELQAGHFIPAAQGNATRWLEDVIHPQCFRCNINLGGNGPEYYPFMIKTYGQTRVDELRALSRHTVKMTIEDYERMIQEYTDKLSRL